MILSDRNSTKSMPYSLIPFIHPIGRRTVQAFRRVSPSSGCPRLVLRRSHYGFGPLRTMPSADFRYAFGKPYGVPSPSSETATGSPGVLPGCFLHITVGSTWCVSNFRTSDCVASLSFSLHTSASYPPIRSLDPICAIRSARVFDSGFLSAPLPGIQLPSSSLRRYLNWDGTNPLIRPNPSVILDAWTGFGTIAERTRKQPGLPGTQPRAAGYSVNRGGSPQP